MIKAMVMKQDAYGYCYCLGNTLFTEEGYKHFSNCSDSFPAKIALDPDTIEKFNINEDTLIYLGN